jgi:hypothetical protein
MSYKGTVKNGVILLESDARLPLRGVHAEKRENHA